MSAHIMTDEAGEETIMGEETMPDSASGANASLTWFEANQRYLAAAISALRVHLQATLRANASAYEPSTQAEDALLDLGAWTFSQPPALEQLCSAFELSAFERGVLLLAAGAEMDSQLAELYASLGANPRFLPTLNLALTVLPEAHWSALSPSRALRRWQLIDILPADTLIASAFRPNERILHFLAGVSGIDERLHHLFRPVPPPDALPLSYADLARQVAAVWTDASRHWAASSMTPQLPLIELCGAEPDANRAIAAGAAAAFNLRLYALSPRNLLQTSSAETDLLLRLWEREAVLSGTALLLESEDLPTADTTSATLALLLE